MKHILFIFFTTILLISMVSCESEDEYGPLKEYVNTQPGSFIFETVTTDDDVVNYEFGLANFEPVAYQILRLTIDGDGDIVGTTSIKEVDISNEEVGATIKGSLAKEDVFSTNEAGETSELRLILTSVAGNWAIAEHRLPIIIEAADAPLSPLVGTWQGPLMGAPATIIMNEDGSGTIDAPDLGLSMSPITWSATDTELTIGSAVPGVGGTYGYSFNTGNDLVIDGMGTFTFVQPFLGTWSGTIMTAPATIVFNEDGTGTVDIPLLLGGQIAPFDWTVDLERNITIVSPVTDINGTYAYSINEAGNLVLDGLGEFSPV